MKILLIVLAIVLCLAGSVCGDGGFVVAKLRLPRVVFWTGSHWEEFSERYFLAVGENFDDDEGVVTLIPVTRERFTRAWEGEHYCDECE